MGNGTELKIHLEIHINIYKKSVIRVKCKLTPDIRGNKDVHYPVV